MPTKSYMMSTKQGGTKLVCGTIVENTTAGAHYMENTDKENKEKNGIICHYQISTINARTLRLQ